jgi:hypothetical protein
MLKIASITIAGRGKKDSFLQDLEICGPADILTSDLQPLEL